MIRLEVVDLLAKYQRPHVLAQKLDHIQRIREAWAIPRKPTGHPVPHQRCRRLRRSTAEGPVSPLGQPLPHPVPQALEPAGRRVPAPVRPRAVAGEAVGHGDHLDQQQVEAGGVQEGGAGVGGVGGRQGSLERHGGDGAVCGHDGDLQCCGMPVGLSSARGIPKIKNT